MSKILLIKDSVVNLETDVIVNAANRNLREGGGVCGAIFTKANSPLLQKECDKLAPIETGGVAITNGYNLKAKYIIHAVGPVYKGDGSDEKLLASCYTNTLNVMKEHNLHSVGFPCISTGIFGYPLKEASEIAVKTVKKWIDDNKDYDVEVFFTCFKDEEYKIYKELI